MLHSKVDLNLFLVLRTVYQEGSITHAAAKLHLTQPAISHALARLRERFDDPLFVRHGRTMRPSSLCQNIMPMVENALNLLEATLQPNIHFDIRQHQRELKFGLRDILESLFIPPLVADLTQHTPNITVNSRQIKRTDMESVLENQEIDIVIDVLTPTSDSIHHELICNENFSLICRREHPYLENPSLENYAKAQHVLVSLKDSEVDIVDMALAKQGEKRNIALRCEHYFAATSVISHCDMLLTMPNAYANILRVTMPVEVLPLPFEVPPLPVHMYWHKSAEQDLVNAWMRKKLVGIAHQLQLPR